MVAVNKSVTDFIHFSPCYCVALFDLGKISKEEGVSVFAIYRSGFLGSYGIVKKELCGSITIETTGIFGVILLAFLLITYATFYYHDKIILSGMAYETAVVGCQKYRTVGGFDQDELMDFIEESAKKKAILFHHFTVEIETINDTVKVQIYARKKNMKLFVEQTCTVIKPEHYIRELRKIKDIVK
ncbi:TadE family protein [Lachnospiraceae bacterium LCP25S3_G4]